LVLKTLWSRFVFSPGSSSGLSPAAVDRGDRSRLRFNRSFGYLAGVRSCDRHVLSCGPQVARGAHSLVLHDSRLPTDQPDLLERCDQLCASDVASSASCVAAVHSSPKWPRMVARAGSHGVGGPAGRRTAFLFRQRRCKGAASLLTIPS